MNVSLELDPRLRKYVNAKLRAGDFASLGEMVKAALARLQAEDEAWKKLSKQTLDRLRKEVAIGIEQLDRGESAPWDVEEIKREGRRLLAARRRKAS